MSRYTVDWGNGHELRLGHDANYVTESLDEAKAHAAQMCIKGDSMIGWARVHDLALPGTTHLSSAVAIYFNLDGVAVLQHPSIMAIIDAGTRSTGRPSKGSVRKTLTFSERTLNRLSVHAKRHGLVDKRGPIISAAIEHMSERYSEVSNAVVRK